jgi:hypothetical protein
MQHIENFISTELRYPTSTSKKKKRYVVFTCAKCGKAAEKVYMKSRWKSQCHPCMAGLFTTAQFITLGKAHFGEHYDYSKTVYTGNDSSVTIICPVHGEFTQRAQEHMNGHGCNKCKFARKSIDQKLPLEVWLQRLEAYPLITAKDLGTLGYHTQITLSCAIHGDFTTTLGAIGKNIHLCPLCASQSHQIQSIRKNLIGRQATIYYVYLPLIDMYKFGVTVDLEARLRSLQTEYKLLAIGIKEYTEALRLEHEAHIALDMHRYKGTKKLLLDGSTELYKNDVLKQLKRALQQ